MEITFDNKVLSSYREVFHQLKRFQESADSVVSDTNDDIGRIAAVQTSVLLKSKDISNRGVTVSGEAEAVILYITENEKTVSNIKLVKPFTVEYDINELQSEAKAQINLQISNAEARILNPRKVSVTFELVAELSCYMPENIDIDVSLPENIHENIHLKYENTEAELPNAVCEKTFALNEQFVFPAAKPVPQKLIYENSDFCIDDIQNIGSKLIIKGSVYTEIYYTSAEADYPFKAKFTSSFSQIVDTGKEQMDSCTLIISMTSEYYELIDTISGEKALDTELHAVIQLVSRCRQQIRYISDAYCNTMPAICTMKNAQIGILSDNVIINPEKNENIELPEDCSDVLCVLSSVSQCSAVQGRISASVNLDIIYKTKSDTLSSVRRTVKIEEETEYTVLRILKYRLTEVNIKPENNILSVKLRSLLNCQSISAMEISRVCELELDEDKCYDVSKFPAISLVDPEDEDVWELAKKYHSSPERIEAYNSGEENEKISLLLIPKEI